MKIKISFFLFLLFFTTIIARPLDTLWTKTYGGNNSDVGRDVKQTIDGGYIFAGYTSSFGVTMNAYYLVKTDTRGDTLWTKIYDGRYRDEAYSVCQTSAKGYLITGWSSSYASGRYLYTIKTDSLGDTVSTRLYQRAGYSWGWSVFECPEQNGYIIGGHDNNNPYLMKIAKNGDTVWTQRYGQSGVLYSTQLTGDSGFISTGGFGFSSQLFLLKTDKNGVSRWSKTYAAGDYAYGQCVRATSDRGYIVVGYINNATDADLWLLKTDSLGDTVWTKRYGGADDDYGYSVVQTPDNGYIAVGSTYSFGTGDADIWLLRTDANGETLWTKTIGDTAAEHGYCIEKTSDGGYIIGGTTRSHGAGSNDYYLIKLKAETDIKAESAKPIKKHNFGPTIINGPLILPSSKTYRVFDISGRQVNLHKLKPGIYFIKIEGKPIRKIVKLK